MKPKDAKHKKYILYDSFKQNSKLDKTKLHCSETHIYMRTLETKAVAGHHQSVNGPLYWEEEAVVWEGHLE